MLYPFKYGEKKRYKAGNLPSKLAESIARAGPGKLQEKHCECKIPTDRYGMWEKGGGTSDWAPPDIGDDSFPTQCLGLRLVIGQYQAD